MTANDSAHLCSDCQKPLHPTEHEHKHLHCHAHDSSHGHCHWHSEEDESLDNIMQLQLDGLQHYQVLQQQFSQRQLAQQISELQAIEHLLNVHIRPLIESARDELTGHHFHTGIAEDVLTLGQDESAMPFVVGLTLHMADSPVSEANLVKQNIHSGNLIRFSRITDSGDIQCQFMNTKMQSRVFPLSFDREQDTEVIRGIIYDFIRFTLLSRRAEMVSIN